MKAERVVLQGRVHGVGFRAAVVEVARRHAVGGYVRNAGSDRLEIEVEGESEVLDAFVADVLANPPQAARVDAMTREARPVSGLRGFRWTS